MSSLKSLALGTFLSLSTVGAIPAIAQEAPAKTEAMISVTGHSEQSLPTDMALITLSVVKTQETAALALKDNSTVMAEVIAAIKSAKVEDKDIQTSNFSVVPQYFYQQSDDGKQLPPKLTGYTVTNSVVVRMKDVARVGELLDLAISKGVNQGGDIRFLNSDPNEAISRARAGAVKDALAKAQEIADAAQMKLGRVVLLAESNIIGPTTIETRAQFKAQDGAGQAVPVENGENTYSVDVTLNIAIEK